MAELQLVVSDPETGETFQRTVDGQEANRLLGRELGDEIDGGPLGFEGITLELTGGSDDAGRPMRENVPGPNLKELLLEGGVGFHPSREGERKRVTVRGREVSESTAQVNATVVEGSGLAEAFGEGDEDEE